MEVIKGQSLSIMFISDVDLDAFTKSIYAFSYPNKTEIIPSSIVRVDNKTLRCSFTSGQTSVMNSGKLCVVIELTGASGKIIGRSELCSIVEAKSAIINENEESFELTMGIGAQNININMLIGSVISITDGDGGGGTTEMTLTPTIESIVRPVRSDVNFVFEGNSRTSTMRFHEAGTVGFENQFPAYPEQLMELSNFKNRGNFFNVAVWGTDNATVFSRYNANVKPRRPAANGGQAGITEAYLFIMSGILDLIFYPATVDAKIAGFKSYCATAKADGFKVVVVNEFFGSNTVYEDAAELARLKYNAAMMDYAREGGIYMCIDVDGLIGTDMTNIYRADTTFHLTTKGKALIADYINSCFAPGMYRRTHSFQSYVTFSQLYAKVDKTDSRLTNSRPASDVSAWAKSSVKPSYTAAEVGAQPALGFTPENAANKKTTLTDSDVDIPTTRAVNTGLAAKQPTLVSGTNIKTINGQPLVGSGNIEISGGGGEPVITKSVGLLSWTGTAWAWIANNFLSTTAKITTANVESAVDLKHTHTNKSILDSIQEALTTALKTGYDTAAIWISTNGANVLTHLADATKHVTSTDKTNWNAKVDTSDSRLTNSRPASDVSAWAKAATKPTYTAAEVGAQPSGTYATGGGTATGTNTGDQDLTGLATKLILYVEKTASFTLANTDSDKWLNCNHASTPIVITVPTGLIDGKQFFVFQRGAAAVSVVAGSGMTALATKLTANAQYSAFQISIEGTNFKVIGETKA